MLHLAKDKIQYIMQSIHVWQKTCPKRRGSCFSTKKNGNYNDFIFGVVTGIDGRKVGINGVIVNPVGLKNKIEQGKTENAHERY